MPEQKKRNRREILLIVIIGVLVIANLIKWYADNQNRKEMQEQMDKKELELFDTYTKLDSISNQVEIKIEKIRSLGGRIDSLVTLKEELEQDKYNLRVAKSITQKRYNEIKEKVEGYESLLLQKDEEIEKLKVANTVLLAENQDLKTDKSSLISKISNLESEKGVLQKKVSTAATLRAEGIEVYAISKSGKEISGGSFRIRQLDKLKIAFKVAENDLAELGTKEVFMRLIDPNQSVLYNVTSSNSGTFTKDGKDLFFTQKKDFLFDNSNQTVEIEFYKGSEFRKGLYRVELYNNEEVIGETTFIVK